MAEGLSCPSYSFETCLLVTVLCGANGNRSRATEKPPRPGTKSMQTRTDFSYDFSEVHKEKCEESEQIGVRTKPAVLNTDPAIPEESGSQGTYITRICLPVKGVNCMVSLRVRENVTLFRSFGAGRPNFQFPQLGPSVRRRCVVVRRAEVSGCSIGDKGCNFYTFCF